MDMLTSFRPYYVSYAASTPDERGPGWFWCGEDGATRGPFWSREDALAAIAKPAERPSTVTSYPGRRRFATPGEARAAERGYADHPRWIEDSAAYLTGWHDADAFERVREESRSERAQARRDE